MLVTRNGERWEFRPARASFLESFLGSIIVSAIGLAGLFFLVFESASVRLPRDFGGLLCFFFALVIPPYTLFRAVQYWNSRKTALIIEDSGRISYGGNEICAPGTVRAVVVEDR